MLRLPLRQRRRLIKLGSLVVLLFAVAPQVLYLGQPLNDEQVTNAVQSMPPGHEHHAETAAEHANHCHVGPKGCAASDGAANVASFPNVTELLAQEPGMSAIETQERLHTFALWQAPEKPPQPV